MIQFLYRFPVPVSSQIRESRIVFVISTLVTLSYGGVATFMTIQFYRTFELKSFLFIPKSLHTILLLTALVWMLFVGLRKTLYLSETPYPKKMRWYKKVLTAQGKDVEALRALGIVSMFLLSVLVVFNYLVPPF